MPCHYEAMAMPELPLGSGLGAPFVELISKHQWLEIQQRALHGQLAASAAHEMGNLLTIVLFNAGLLKEHFTGNPEANRHLTPLLHSATSLARLCGQMRNVSRLAPETAARIVDLKEVFKDTPQLFNRLIPQKITLVLEEPDPLPVLADPGHLEQIMLNLVLNASDATDEHTGLIQIRLGCDREDGWRYWEIEDNGPGIPAHIRETLFRSCITTKPRGKGTGLGLMTVGWLVTNMKGRITLRCAPEQGTVIRISLPDPSAATGSLPPGRDPGHR